MATFVKFQNFIEALGDGTHHLKAAGDTFEVYLSNATPDVAADAVKADLAEITNQNGYTAPVDIQNDASESGGTLTMTAVDVTVTASGGTVGPFRYAVIFNQTATGDPLMGYYDYGSAITLQDTEQFVINFGASLATFA